MPSKLNLKGLIFGRWTVIEEDKERSNGGFVTWRCRCECGAIVSVSGVSLKNGKSKSCGCYKADRAKEFHTVHGQASASGKSREYGIWAQIRQRCRNEYDKAYPKYGGIGICICDKWADSFEAFFADTGKAPSIIHSLDRYPNRKGNYEPGNVRWATPKQQIENRDCSVWLTYNGITMLMGDWTRKLKLGHDTIKYRLRKGETFDKIISHLLNKNIISASDIS